MKGRNKMTQPVVIIFNLPPQLKSALAQQARANDRTLSAELRSLIRQSVGARTQTAAVEAR